mgnify:FL=1
MIKLKSKSAKYIFISIIMFSMVLFICYMVQGRVLVPSEGLAPSQPTAQGSPDKSQNTERDSQPDIAHDSERHGLSVKSVLEMSESRKAGPERAKAFADSRNLAVIVDQLSAAVSAKDGEAMGITARAYDECNYFRVVPNGSDRIGKMLDGKTELERQIGASHRAVAEQRCLSLASRDGWDAGEISTLREGAASNGDAYGLAMALESDTDSDLSSRIMALRRIVMSGDPEAIGVMAMGLGESNEFAQDVRGPYAGTVVDVIAWNLVACSLGRDCGQGGALMRALCLNQGLCLAIGYREYLQRYVATPDQFLEAEAKEEEILHLIEIGGYDQIFPILN